MIEAPKAESLAVQTPKGEFVAPALSAEDGDVSPEEREQLLNSPAPGLKMNPNLARIAAHLASHSEIDGLWLTGTAVKAATTVAQSLETEDKPDIQSAGNAVIKRFAKVLPQRFKDLVNGSSPQPFNWKDPHSGKQYHFEFETAVSSPEGNLLTPAALKGFEESQNSKKPVFVAQLIDSNRGDWNIELCNFNPAQLRSLSVCDRGSRGARGQGAGEREGFTAPASSVKSQSPGVRT